MLSLRSIVEILMSSKRVIIFVLNAVMATVEGTY